MSQFMQETIVQLAPGADPRAVGGAITLALRGICEPLLAGCEPLLAGCEPLLAGCEPSILG